MEPSIKLQSFRSALSRRAPRNSRSTSNLEPAIRESSTHALGIQVEDVGRRGGSPAHRGGRRPPPPTFRHPRGASAISNLVDQGDGPSRLLLHLSLVRQHLMS